MARDYAKKPPKKRKAQAKRVSSKPKETVDWSLPVGVWIAVGIVIGFIFAWLLTAAGIMNPQPVDTPQVVDQQVAKPKQSAVKPVEKKPVAKKPVETAETKPKKTSTTFEFYNELPKRTVSTPKQPAHETEPEIPFIYYLQTGSFKDAADADSMRAQLILEGYTVRIETNTKGDTTWHRVQIGPIKSRSKMSQIRVRLLEKNINPLVYKVKAG